VTERESVEHPPAADSAEMARALRISQELEDRTRQFVGTGRLDEKAGLAVHDTVDHAPDSRRHERALHQQRLDRAAEVFVE